MDMAATGDALNRLLGKRVQSLARIGRGGNSKVYRVLCEDGTGYAAKFYFQRTMDGLDRLEVEFGGLSFLWQKGARWIPRPIAADAASQIGVYEFIEGDAIDSGAVSERDIEAMVSFASHMKRLMNEGDAEALPHAAEACFSLQALYDSVLRRLQRLNAVRGECASHVALHEFLSAELAPALESVAGRIQDRSGAPAWRAELAPSAWTLSPSDFGFHNALRRPDGSLVLLDFEYFGKDDPAKMIADFVLHPGMHLTESVKQRYVTGMLECFRADSGLPARLNAAYPLYGLKWCAILLNEFVPRFLERREFAVEDGALQEEVRMRQLGKARGMLERTQYELTHYPFAV